MSRIGKRPVAIPSGVSVSTENGILSVKGPKGELSKSFNHNLVAVSVEDGSATVEKKRNTRDSQALWGTYASHLANMIKGVSEGYQRKLIVEGVGYRAEVRGQSLVLNLGYSHPVEIVIPEGIQASVEKNAISLVGFDKELVGQFAALIRKQRPPEPYKGKGIRYDDEVVRRKEGKKSV